MVGMVAPQSVVDIVTHQPRTAAWEQDKPVLMWGDPLPPTQHPAFLPFIPEPGRSTHRNTEQQWRKGHEGWLVSRTGFCHFKIYIK